MALYPLAQSLAAYGNSFVLDFPGFGASPPPPSHWATADYADHVAKWLESTPPSCRIWIGHSFGCRVGLQLAARHPHLLSGLVLIAAAGLRPKRSVRQQSRFLLKRYSFRIVRSMAGEGALVNALRSRVGSSDYKSAGALRPILSRVVTEDLSEIAKSVKAPVILIYGENDTDTPPEMGRRLQSFIAGSQLIILKDFDHHTVLTDGRHQLVSSVKSFTGDICRSSI
jgi:pimeloyl-ACP methyl ester carboxylesterase